LKARLPAGERILNLEDRLVEARESMRFQATRDVLTSLWNEASLSNCSREKCRARREGNSVAVMMCDIDHFKAVNDEFGHAAGDDVLREVSRRLHHSARSYDMVGRYGGEEFLVVLNRCDPASAVARAENLRVGIAGKLISTPSKATRVTISVGLALSVDFPQSDVDEVIHQADWALYAAKRAGRNCVRLAPLASEPEARNGIATESTALST
jgi:two-component system, cell cycle response regulator